MDTLEISWRVSKCRLKRDHYYKYDNYEKRLKSCPDNVPEDHFKVLLRYWASAPAKQEMRCLEAFEVDESGNSCKDSFDEVMGDGGTGHKRLARLGFSHKNPPPNAADGSLILPKEVMKSIKTAVVADVQKELSVERE